MDNNMIKLISMLRNKRELDAKINEAIIAAFPVGKEVSFYRGTGLVHAKITDHCNNERIRVKNIFTDNEYWIDIHYLLNH